MTAFGLEQLINQTEGFADGCLLHVYVTRDEHAAHAWPKLRRAASRVLAVHIRTLVALSAAATTDCGRALHLVAHWGKRGARRPAAIVKGPRSRYSLKKYHSRS